MLNKLTCGKRHRNNVCLVEDFLCPGLADTMFGKVQAEQRHSNAYYSFAFFCGHTPPSPQGEIQRISERVDTALILSFQEENLKAN